LILFSLLLMSAAPLPAPNIQALNPAPPEHVVKLIFIHHSTGENWLADGYGDLGKTLDQNNYFVSDTNYGWGPDSIGDRTDIPNWVEWFSSGGTERYMQALLNENEQHSPYTRSLSDPGGENEIILFKSCFPNSALEGSPDDPPGTYEELTVGGAKYVYNEILGYFANHPEKLFIVITAPPLSDAAYADNARAFNNWLVNDWLSEYPLSNVAVFDFYNVLTDPDAHHRINNGQVEYIPGGQNTLAYPSGDDHPSEAGSRKATEEFVPLLNSYYRRWKADAAPGPLVLDPGLAPQADQPTDSAPPSATSSLVAAFESGEPAWEAYHDEATTSIMTCQPESDTGRSGNSLRLDFNIAANSWGTCARMYESPQNWSDGDGLSFYFSAEEAGTLFDIDLYAGPAENRETYLYTIEASPESAAGWVQMELRWSDFHRADWEESAGAPFAKPNEVTGIAFGMNTLPDATNAGTLRVDDMTLFNADSTPVNPPSEAEPPEEPQSRGLNCSAAAALPLALAGLAFWQKRSRSR
jgi:hypothetical protein